MLFSARYNLNTNSSIFQVESVLPVLSSKHHFRIDLAVRHDCGVVQVEGATSTFNHAGKTQVKWFAFRTTPSYLGSLDVQLQLVPLSASREFRLARPRI
jgi:hypothetical protein